MQRPTGNAHGGLCRFSDECGKLDRRRRRDCCVNGANTSRASMGGSCRSVPAATRLSCMPPGAYKDPAIEASRSPPVHRHGVCLSVLHASSNHSAACGRSPHHRLRLVGQNPASTGGTDGGTDTGSGRSSAAKDALPEQPEAACGGCNCGQPNVQSGSVSPQQACALEQSFFGGAAGELVGLQCILRGAQRRWCRGLRLHAADRLRDGLPGGGRRWWNGGRRGRRR